MTKVEAGVVSGLLNASQESMVLMSLRRSLSSLTSFFVVSEYVS